MVLQEFVKAQVGMESGAVPRTVRSHVECTHTLRGREGVNCSPKEGQEADQLCAIAAAAIKSLCLRGQGVTLEGKEILLVNLVQF